MQTDLIKILKWCDENLMLINYNKCSYMLFERRSVDYDNLDFEIKISNTVIERVKSVKYLGLIIDSKLNYQMHIDSLKHRLRSMSFAIRRSRFYIQEKTAWMMYFAFIHSKLIYVNPIWSCTSENRLNQLQVLQNGVIKSIRKLPRLHPTKLLYDDSILPLDVLKDFELVFCIFKLKFNLLKCNRVFTLNQDIHHHATRMNNDFHIKTISTTHGYNNIFHRGLLLFNSLPHTIKDELRISTFKTLLKKHLMNMYQNE